MVTTELTAERATQQTTTILPAPSWPMHAAPEVAARPVIRGKFLYAGDQKLYIKGVTYGPFRPTQDGSQYRDRAMVDRDFAMMAMAGINAVRTYTVPPRWLLDAALQHGLRVMVGVPWEQHIAFLDDRNTPRRIERTVREAVRACAGHPAVLAFAVGNEIPAPIVRWYGRTRIERFLRRFVHAVKSEDPAALATYVNYPTTEYLQLDFLDFVCFNVYLEDQRTLSNYLARLQNLAGDRPLVMGEVGLDSIRNGAQRQAQTLAWQVREAFAAGCAGMFVFAWTDEWHRGGFDIEDWDFGITRRDRRPKPAFYAVSRAYRQTPFSPALDWPSISVVVCTYNGARTIAQTLRGITRLDYPDFEMIVVADGSSDNSAAIARQYGARVIEVENGGLSRARNIGMRHARGSIVVYIDDDAYPDPQWLRYIAWTFMNSDVVAVGGPNLPPPEDGLIARCVAQAPGGPNHVLLTDRIAEHIPGCNMAIRRSALEAIGGFDEQFRIAGDDVDVCWRLQERGGTIGFHPAAMVWHHRRNTVRGYLRQQTNYGRAEAMLERKWPGKYNHFGHIPWRGRIYGSGLPQPLILRRWRVYHGVWGTQLFQTIYTRPPGLMRWLPLMPEWYLLTAGAMILMAAAVLWRPLLWLAPLLMLLIGAPVAQAVLSAATAPRDRTQNLPQRLRYRAIIAWLHLAQPVVRLWGRLSYGLTPWRRPRVHQRLALPRLRQHQIWSQTWTPIEQRMAKLEAALHRAGVRTMRGGAFDRWDLEVCGGFLGGVRTLMTVEEHGAGRQMVRLRSWPIIQPTALAMLLVGLGLVAIGGTLAGMIGAVLLGVLWLAVVVRLAGDCAAATAAYLEAVNAIDPAQETATP